MASFRGAYIHGSEQCRTIPIADRVILLPLDRALPGSLSPDRPVFAR